MSYLEYTVKTVPTGLRKILYFNWALALLLTTIAALGILQLYSCLLYTSPSPRD